MLASWLGGCDAAWPPPPPPQSFTLTTTASPKAAVQAFNANAALALAEYGPITETHQAKESSRSFRTALLLMLATWLPGATARTAAQAAPPQSYLHIQGGVAGLCVGQWDMAQQLNRGG